MPETTLVPSLEAGDVAHYLDRHPRFLESFPNVASKLLVPRENGPAASLAAYQIETLRARNRELSERLSSLIQNARDNEELLARVHTLTVGLLGESSLEDTCKRVVATLHEDFHADLVRLLLWRADAALAGADWWIPVPEGASALPDFAEFLGCDEPACGRLPAAKLEHLFGVDAHQVQSAALLKIGDQGLLAIGSRDANRFHPGIGTWFLKLIAQALDAGIARFPVT